MFNQNIDRMKVVVIMIFTPLSVDQHIDLPSVEIFIDECFWFE